MTIIKEDTTTRRECVRLSQATAPSTPDFSLLHLYPWNKIDSIGISMAVRKMHIKMPNKLRISFVDSLMSPAFI